MNIEQKLIDKLIARSKSFKYDEAKSLLTSLGFTKSNKGKTSGSRVVFILGFIRIEIHKPRPQKDLKQHQVLRLLSKLESEGII